MITLEEFKLDPNRRDCEDPRIDTEPSYLVKVYGKWHAGKFRKAWYGWYFTGWGTSGIQLNSSGIEALYEIKDCQCLCHDGYGGAHPNEKCPCHGGPENEWTEA